MSVSRQKIIKVLLSLFVLYHLSAVILLPIGGSLIGRRLSRYVLPYANSLSLNTTWQFFSPGPSPMFYLEYDVELADGTELGAQEPLVYPPPRTSMTWDDGWNRRLFGMRFFALNPERMERFFAPFLCEQHPGAKTISVQAIFEKVEDYDRATHSDGLWNSDFRDNTERIDLPRQHFRCPEGGPA